jgi:hypothetical protein
MSSTSTRRQLLSGLLGATGLLALPAKANDAWQVELADMSGEGKYSSLRIDQDGNIHLAYVIEEDSHPLQYAYRDKRLAKWFKMNVAQDVGMCALALDSKQHPHIAFADYGTGSGAKLRHAYWNGAEWHAEPIRLDSEIIAYYTSIALDREDHPSITFYEYRGPKDSEISIRLRNVMYNGQFWEARYVDPDGGSGKFNAMAVDAQGGLHIAYANVSFGDMRYAYWNGHNWRPEMVEQHSNDNGGTYLGYSAAIALDKAGVPHLTYSDPNNRVIKYAVRRESRWQTQFIDKVHGVGYPDRNGIALDNEGRAYVTYYDAGRQALKLAFRDHDRWVAGIIDPDHSGFTSSAQIADGEIWISYASEAGGVKVAHTSVKALHDQVPPEQAQQMPSAGR